MQQFYDRKLIITGTVAALFVVLVTGSLGEWQLRRAAEKIAWQQARDAAAAAPPTRLGAERVSGADPAPGNGSAAPVLPSPDAVAGTRTLAVGVFAAEHSVFLDNRTRDGIAGFHVLTPLKLSGSNSSLLVLRGWIARDPIERMRLPALETPSGTVEVEGLAMTSLPQPMMLAADTEPAVGERIWQRFGFDKFSRWSGLAVYPVIVRQTVEPGYEDRLARDWIQPGSSVDRHHGYAFQWFAMTATAVIAWLVLIVKSLRRRPGAAS